VLILTVSIATSVFGFDMNALGNLLREEMKKTFGNKDFVIRDIKFIGFAPKEDCIPERIQIRELKRPSSVEFTFYCKNRQYRAIGNYEVFLSLYISQRPLKKGDMIKAEDIAEIKLPVQRIPVTAVTDKEELIGRIIKRTIAQGIIIKEEHLYSGIPVKKGSKVNVLITAGKVTVMTEGVLKSDAIVGEMAKVQCIQTGKEIVGRLIEKDKVRVSI